MEKQLVELQSILQSFDLPILRIARVDERWGAEWILRNAGIRNKERVNFHKAMTMLQQWSFDHGWSTFCPFLSGETK